MLKNIKLKILPLAAAVCVGVGTIGITMPASAYGSGWPDDSISMETLAVETAAAVADMTTEEREELINEIGDLVLEVYDLPDFGKWRTLNRYFSIISEPCSTNTRCDYVLTKLNKNTAINTSSTSWYSVLNEAMASSLYQTDSSFRTYIDDARDALSKDLNNTIGAARQLGIELTLNGDVILSVEDAIDKLWDNYDFKFWRALVGNGANPLVGGGTYDYPTKESILQTLQGENNEVLYRMCQYFRAMLALRDPDNAAARLLNLMSDIEGSDGFDEWSSIYVGYDNLSYFLEVKAHPDSYSVVDPEEVDETINGIIENMKEKLAIVAPTFETSTLSPEDLLTILKRDYTSYMVLAATVYEFMRTGTPPVSTPLEIVARWGDYGFGTGFPFSEFSTSDSAFTFVQYHSINAVENFYNARLSDWNAINQSLIIVPPVETPTAPNTGFLGLFTEDGSIDLAKITIMSLAIIASVTGIGFVAKLWLRSKVRF